ncbi:MAG TPA: hypothetical protein VF444_06205 [Pseudonocardiaceae bacterium]
MIARVLSLSLERTWIDLSRMIRSWRFWVAYVAIPLAFVICTGFVATGDTDFARMYLAFGLVLWTALPALVAASVEVISDRSSGTLVRLRGLPYGTAICFIGRIVLLLVISLVGWAVFLVVTAIIAPEILPHDTPHWGILVCALVAEFVMLIPLGLLLGALVPLTKKAVLLLRFGLGVLLLIFGAAPVLVSEVPEWLRLIIDLLPIPLSELEVFAALTSEALGEWPIVLPVLLVWFVVFVIAAVPAMRAMIRRQSGAALARQRERVLAARERRANRRRRPTAPAEPV